MTEPRTAEDELADDFEATARRVTSGPPCRVCRAAMEPGALQFVSTSPVTETIVWRDPGARPDEVGSAVEALTWGPLARYRALGGFRCPECGRLELEYRPSAAARAAGNLPPSNGP